MDQKPKNALETAIDHYKNGFYDFSITELKKILVGDPSNAKAHYQLSLALEKKGSQDNEKAFYILALAEAKQALKSTKVFSKEMHQQMINLYEKNDQLDIAIADYKKRQALEPGNQFYADCVKQITALSACKIPPQVSTGESKKGGMIWWLIFIFIAGAILLVTLLLLSKNYAAKLHS